MTTVGGDAAKRAARAAYYAAHREKALAASRAWKAANRERAREHNRLSMRRSSARKRAEEQKRAVQRAWAAGNRGREQARLRRYRERHPERVRASAHGYQERHPERAAAQSRAASQAWRDRHADAHRQVDREAARERRARDPDEFRRWYQANLERERARSREAARLRARLKALGLPPRHIHRVYAEVRRANTAAADEFFTRRRTAVERRAAARERAAVRPMPAPRAAPPAPREHDTRFVLALQRDEEVWRKVAPPMIAQFQRRHRPRIQEEVRMDSIARRLRGREPLDIGVETSRRVNLEAFAHVASALVPSGNPVRVDRLRAVLAVMARERRLAGTALIGSASNVATLEAPGRRLDAL